MVEKELSSSLFSFFNGRKEEFRCVKRSDLIETMAEALPAGTIRFGCRTIGVQKDTLTSHPILHLDNGSTINSKVMVDEILNFLFFFKA